MKKSPSRFRPWAARLCASLLAILVIASAATLRPIDRSDWTAGQPIKAALEIVGDMRGEMAESVPSPLEAGWAKVPLRCQIGDPLAGYGARDGAPATGLGEDLFARALFLRSGENELVLVTADILLVHDLVAKAVAEICRIAGVDEQSIYFTSTHTHCGPGGWGPNVIEESVCGPYDPKYVERLAETLSKTILSARESAKQAEWTWLSTEVPEFVHNRTVEGGATDPVLDALAVRHLETQTTGVFAFYGAHATCVRADQMAFHADYPGVFVRNMEKNGLDFAAFGAASVGSQSPVGPGENLERANAIGSGLAAKLNPLLPSAEWKKEMTLGSTRQRVPLPDFQVRLTGELRVAEWIADGIHAKDAPIHFARLDNRWLVGLPVEYSSLLSTPLRNDAHKLGVEITPTAFNGDYVGYVLPPEIYDNGAYETKMNFLGPGGGDYFTRLIRAGTGIVKSTTTTPQLPSSAP